MPSNDQQQRSASAAGWAAAAAGFLTQLSDLDLGSIATSDDPMLIVDRDLIIRAYNRAYVAFAAANGLPDDEKRFGLGSDILAAFSEPARTFYAEVYRRVLTEQSTFHQSYECSSPSQRRLFLLSAYASVGGKALVLAHHGDDEGSGPSGPDPLGADAGTGYCSNTIRCADDSPSAIRRAR